MWDTLALELRVHAVIGKISKYLQEVVDSHQPIIDALEKGRGKEAGLLLRNHVEIFLEYLKKSRSCRRSIEPSSGQENAHLVAGWQHMT